MRKLTSRQVTGLVLILFGLVLGAQMLGWFTISVGWLWPLGLIGAGIAYTARYRAVGTLLLLITLVLAGLLVAEHFGAGEPRTFDVALPNASVVAIEYGAGSIDIRAGEARIAGRTTDPSNPAVEAVDGSLLVERRSGRALWGMSEWNVTLAPTVRELRLDYGAASLSLDARGLPLERLDVQTGASASRLTLGRLPTTTTIEAGASSILLLLPDDYPAKVIPHMDVSETRLDGLEASEGAYVTPGFNASAPHLLIRVDGGATALTLDFYG